MYLSRDNEVGQHKWIRNKRRVHLREIRSCKSQSRYGIEEEEEEHEEEIQRLEAFPSLRFARQFHSFPTNNDI